MNKPASLRAQLLASIPELHDNPSRLALTVTQGRLHCTGATSLSWEYAYQLRLTLTDFAGDVDLVLLALLLWVRENQSDLLVNLDQAAQGIGFELATNGLTLLLPLTERVVTQRQADGSYQLSRPADPRYSPYLDAGTWQLATADGALSEWQSSAAGDAVALAMPHPKRSQG
ncbi:tail protein [Pseudomonas oryzihabitans]|nr:tail protein [Pseudomonas psychrotolerans]KTT43454.1 tail protein [Pseudomonas psychrotolerans]